MYDTMTRGKDKTDSSIEIAAQIDAQINTQDRRKSTDDIHWREVGMHIYPFLAPVRWDTRRMDGRTCLAYSRYLDLAVYYYIRSGTNDIIWIERRALERWQIPMEKLWGQAMENMAKDEYTIQHMDKFINPTSDQDTPVGYMKGLPLYALLNKKGFFGATGILDKKILASFAWEMDKDLYILPSSIHEVLLYPDLGQTDMEELDQIVREVNVTQVSISERLADHVYYYDRLLDEIRTEK